MYHACSFCGSTQISAAGSLTKNRLFSMLPNAKSDAGFEAHICVRCLDNLTRIRNHYTTRQRHPRVAKHAIERFIERRAGRRMPEAAARNQIIEKFDRAYRIVFTDEITEERLHNNYGCPVEYFYCDGLILVVTQDSPVTIITVERPWHRILGRDFWYLVEDRYSTAVSVSGAGQALGIAPAAHVALLGTSSGLRNRLLSSSN